MADRISAKFAFQVQINSSGSESSDIEHHVSACCCLLTSDELSDGHHDRALDLLQTAVAVAQQVKHMLDVPAMLFAASDL